MTEPLLQVDCLSKDFRLAGTDKVLHACSELSFSVERGEAFGVIGESGSGKTTLGRMLLRLIEPSSGSIVLDSRDLVALRPRELRKMRAKMHIVFQEPALSMNPQLRIGTQIEEPIKIHTSQGREERKRRVEELLQHVGLPAGFANAVPGMLSGGELQRCSIARAIATNPDLLVLDEPTSALPPALQQDILELLKRLQHDLGLAYVFISHDLSLVRSFCDRIAVMYLGQIVELGTRETIFADPQHPYTRALIASELTDDPQQRIRTRETHTLAGEIPSPIDLPTGCYLASRCAHARDRCFAERQVLSELASGHLTRCWRVASGDLDLGSSR